MNGGEGYLVPSGVIGFIVAGAIALKQLLDWWLAKRAQSRAGQTAERSEDRAETSAAVTDASAANAIMLKSMQALNSENKRQAQRLAAVESENTKLRDENRKQAERIGHLETENAANLAKIDELQQRVQEIADELESMRSSSK